MNDQKDATALWDSDEISLPQRQKATVTAFLALISLMDRNSAQLQFTGRRLSRGWYKSN